MPRGIYKNPEERTRKIKAYLAKRWFKEPAQKICEICNKVFFQSKDERNHQWEKKRFCSLVCKGVASRGKSIHTDEHKAELQKTMTGNVRGFVRGKPSSRKGKKSDKPAWNKGLNMPQQQGQNHWNWVEDRKLLKDDSKERGGQLHREWSKNIKKRDGWKCKLADKDCSLSIIAHHILSWRKYLELHLFNTKRSRI